MKTLSAPFLSALLCCLCTLIAAFGCVSDRSNSPKSVGLLNSERIEKSFGSYGIDVVWQEGNERVSYLYSGAGRRRVTRTVAYVHFEDYLPTELDEIQSRILEGASIGAELKKAGYLIRKTYESLGKYELPVLAGEVFQFPRAEPLAVLQYRLKLSSDSMRTDYATIIEVYHPDYLGVQEVEKLTLIEADRTAGLQDALARLSSIVGSLRGK